MALSNRLRGRVDLSVVFFDAAAIYDVPSFPTLKYPTRRLRLSPIALSKGEEPGGPTDADRQQGYVFVR